ncbi:hypothetical protein [Stenoxybacter acetivorans]|nr:hypothetical protein [Stenoxybacter acetivorans]
MKKQIARAIGNGTHFLNSGCLKNTQALPCSLKIKILMHPICGFRFAS